MHSNGIQRLDLAGWSRDSLSTKALAKAEPRPASIKATGPTGSSELHQESIISSCIPCIRAMKQNAECESTHDVFNASLRSLRSLREEFFS